jgi:hypothetical protein
MKFPSRDAGYGLPHFRIAAVQLFVILNLAVALIRLISVWRYGALFPTTGGEPLVIYPIWKGVHHLPVYEWPLAYPFPLTLYNYLFYGTYAFLLRLVDADGIGIMLWGRLFTPLFATMGAMALWRLVQYHLNLRGACSVLSFVFALSLWFCASIVRGWAFAIRPDMAAIALVMIARWMVVRQPRFGFVLASVFFYLAWSFKQSVVLAFLGVCLFLLFHKRWRALPWFSTGNRYPALVIDPIFHNATRASCRNGCVEGMLQRGEIPTVLLKPDDTSCLQSLSPNYKKVVEAFYLDRLWSIYSLRSSRQAVNKSICAEALPCESFTY